MTMKSIKLLAIVAAMVPMMYSCSGGAGSSSLLFGSLPGVYSQFQEEKDKLTEEAKNIKSEDDKKKLIEKSEKLQNKWSEKIEESAKTLDGKTIDFAESNIKITEPLSLEFERYSSSKSDLLPMFKVNGSAETASEINTDAVYLGATEDVYIVGYNAEGEQVYKIKAGFVSDENVDGKAVVKAAMPVTFGSICFSDKDLENYTAAKTLKLEVLR